MSRRFSDRSSSRGAGLMVGAGKTGTASPVIAFSAALAVLGTPRLWPTAVRLMLATARPGWWKHFPFLPVAPRAYVSMRKEAMFGAAGGQLGADELVAYLQWCAKMRALAR